MMLDYIVVRHDFPNMWIIMRQDLPIQKVIIGIVINITVLYHIFNMD
jgi:hypothetical protein